MVKKRTKKNKKRTTSTLSSRSLDNTICSPTLVPQNKHCFDGITYQKYKYQGAGGDIYISLCNRYILKSVRQREYESNLLLKKTISPYDKRYYVLFNKLYIYHSVYFIRLPYFEGVSLKYILPKLSMTKAYQLLIAINKVLYKLYHTYHLYHNDLHLNNIQCSNKNVFNFKLIDFDTLGEEFRHLPFRKCRRIDTLLKTMNNVLYTYKSELLDFVLKYILRYNSQQKSHIMRELFLKPLLNIITNYCNHKHIANTQAFDLLLMQCCKQHGKDMLLLHKTIANK